jgi:hypothetical protein
VGAVKPNDRERMADDLQALGLYATSNDVRAGRARLTEGIAHVRDYCLKRTLAAYEECKALDAAKPPTPGTWGASAQARLCERRDALQGFLNEWFAYDLNGARNA